MRTLFALLPLAIAALAPSAAFAEQSPAPTSFSGLFTSWNNVNRDSVRAETEMRAPAAGAVPASSELGRSHGQAVALGERVAEAVRRGDCAEGERLAREAGDFPLVRAVRDYCSTRP